MNTTARLAIYGVVLAAAFTAAFVMGGAVIGDTTVANWTHRASGHDMTTTSSAHSDMADHGDMANHGDMSSTGMVATGTALDGGGYRLSPINAPTTTTTAGSLSFQILDIHGDPLTRFATVHDKALHLIAVRTDGADYRHAHPTLDAATGTWTLPWTWATAGTHRIYADFTPQGGTNITLSREVEIGGSFVPVASAPSRTATVAGFTVTLSGRAAAGAATPLKVTVTRAGADVTSLQPYLGAFGHLVALRDGDLAYLHVHPVGDEPAAGETSGPTVAFAATFPSAGRYFLDFDFQVDGTVHTAPFVVDASVH